MKSLLHVGQYVPEYFRLYHNTQYIYFYILMNGKRKKKLQPDVSILIWNRVE